MSSTNDSISVTSIDATSAHFGAVTTDSINNENTITTKIINANDAVVGNNLNVNGNIHVHGAITSTNGMSFGDGTMLNNDGDFSISGILTASSAVFDHETRITTDQFQNGNGTWLTEGVVSAHNLHAAHRVIVGDSAFRISVNPNTIMGDTFATTFKSVTADIITTAQAEFQQLQAELATLNQAEIQTLTATKVIAQNIQASNFSAVASLSIRDLNLKGSATIEGGLVIDGASPREAALVVGNYPAIFNKGIKVWSKEGALLQTATIVGTSSTIGSDASDSDDNKYAFNTAIGVRARFHGPVVIDRAKLIAEDSKVLAEDICVIPDPSVASAVDLDTPALPSQLRLLKNGASFNSDVERQVTYTASDTASDDDLAGVTSNEIRERAAQPYTGKAVDITSPRAALEVAKERATKRAMERQARAISITNQTKAFRVKTGNGAKYRIDAGGNILMKRGIIEDLQASKISVHELFVDTFQTNHLRMEQIAIEGVVTAQEGMSIGYAGDNSGTTEVFGNVYNYATVEHKNTSVEQYKDQSLVQFTDNATLKVDDGAQFIAGDSATVSLHGVVEIDTKNLILFNSDTGKRYRVNLRDAQGEEGDDPGDLALELVPVVEEQVVPVATTVAGTAHARTALRADLDEFQEKLRRI